MVHCTCTHTSSRQGMSVVHASPVHGLRAIMDLGLISITFTSGASKGFFSIVWIFCFVPLFPTGYDLAKVYKNFPKALPERENCLTSMMIKRKS